METEQIQARLRAAGIENARMEAQLLVDALQGDALQRAVERRCAGYPLQYLLGEWYFYRECYEVNEHCLIPRSDTELLVELAVKELPQRAQFLDLCTGSGCVAISTLCARQDASGIAVDLYKQTLALAARNRARNGVDDRLQLLCADVLQAPPTDLLHKRFSAILSNPPYIRAAAMESLQREVRFEPSAALYGGEDGMDFYRAILQNWTQLLLPDGLVLFEIGYDQREEITRLSAACDFSCSVYQDLAGNDRVALLRR